MANGKPLVDDIEVLAIFDEPFLVKNVYRDERFAIKHNLHIKQVYYIWNKPKYSSLIEYGITLRGGWLTLEGEKIFKKLKVENKRNLSEL